MHDHQRDPFERRPARAVVDAETYESASRRAWCSPSRRRRPPSSTACCAIGWSAWPGGVGARLHLGAVGRRQDHRPPSTPRSRSAAADATAWSWSTPICAARGRRMLGLRPRAACATWWPGERRDRRLPVALRQRRAVRAARRQRARRSWPRRSTTRGLATLLPTFKAALRLRDCRLRRRCCRSPMCRRCARDLDGAVLVVRAGHTPASWWPRPSTRSTASPCTAWCSTRSMPRVAATLRIAPQARSSGRCPPKR